MYPFQNLNGSAIDVKEWISNFILHILMDIITYPCRYQSWTMLAKGPQVFNTSLCARLSEKEGPVILSIKRRYQTQYVMEKHTTKCWIHSKEQKIRN